MLQIQNLTKYFGSKRILNNVSLAVRHGEIAVLLGSSGVGKSTLLRILNNLESYDDGVCYLDGEILDISSVNRTHQVGMVFQQFNLFEHLTVQENITLPLERALGLSARAAREKARTLLEEFHLLDKAGALASRLSGGQKQRLAIARTLAMDPQIVCFDEPTSALDPLLSSFVAESIQALARRNLIILVATHDTGLLEKLSCSIYLMHKGEIVEQTTDEEFRKQPSATPALQAFVQGVTHHT